MEMSLNTCGLLSDKVTKKENIWSAAVLRQEFKLLSYLESPLQDNFTTLLTDPKINWSMLIDASNGC